jgi:hypothetical protein
MAREIWSTPLGKFVREFGADELAERLNYCRSAVYHWVAGTVVPRNDTAQRLVRIAQRNHFDLTVEDVLFNHRKEVARIQADARKERNAGTRS